MHKLNSDDAPVKPRFFVADVFSNSHKMHIWDVKNKRLVCGNPCGYYKLRKRGHVTADGACEQLKNLTKYCCHCMMRVED